MAKQDNDTLYAIAAAYADADAAIADYEAIKALYHEVKDLARLRCFGHRQGRERQGPHRQEARRADPSRRSGRAGWCLAGGVSRLLFPPVGIRIAAAAVTGAAIGGVAGHVHGGVSRGDLKDLGKTLDAGQAGLIAVYETNLADQVAANIKAANRVVSRATDMAADQFAADIKQASAEGPLRSPLSPPAPRRPRRP